MTMTKAAVLMLLAFAITVGTVPTTAAATEYGTFTLDTRLRFETADAEGRKDAKNLSLRLRPGYTTPAFHGFSAMAEGEFTIAADRGWYNAAGVHGDAGKAVIADPENAQLDQLWIDYNNKEWKTAAKVGRQVITLDNHRFVGHVGWRQNRQTYDAVSVRSKIVDNLTIYYAYLEEVIRIFGNEAPDSGPNAEDFDSDSHIVNVAFKPFPELKLTVYGYLLDFDDAPDAVTGSNTFGLSATGTHEIADGAVLGYRAEFANQEDAADSPLNYDADYYHFVANCAWLGAKAELGYEELGADGTAAFQTPLATGHAFNGFADKFLVTPASGLRDLYASLGYTFSIPSAGPLITKVIYHSFDKDRGSGDLGDEWDLLAVKPFSFESVPGKFKSIAKFATYNGSAGDIDRFTLELNYNIAY